jgi:glycerophosphoryl diester phosphodiesterase
MLVIAHRGASAYAPENTAAAFDLAIDMNAGMIETDLQVTRDGHLVLIHDDLVDRTANGSGPVSDYTLTELRALDAGSWFGDAARPATIPTLDEFVETWLPRIPACLEIKDPLATSATIDFLRQLGPRDDIHVTSFSWTALLHVRAAVDVTTGFLCKRFSEDIIDRCVARGIFQICPPAEQLDGTLVDLAHARGLTVRAWGVRSREDVDRVFATGADGATTNWPDWMTEHPANTGEQGR